MEHWLSIVCEFFALDARLKYISMFAHFYMKMQTIIHGVNGIAGSKTPSGGRYGFYCNHRKRWVDME